ncbi:MAG: SH3 domain-containing protein [Oscillospiraceae bacterium]|nr:SH3 domain-containing protein [Oscillospiraceae bacterium]
MKKWGLLVAALLLLCLMWSVAVADAPDYPAVVVNNNHLGDRLPLYAQPREDARRLGEYINGTTAWLLEDQGEWSLVRLGDGTEGYFLSERLMNMEALTRLVPLNRARQLGLMVGVDDLPVLLLYDYPLADAPTREVPMAMRKTIDILNPFGTWYHVRLEDGREGYIPCQDLDAMSTLTYQQMMQIAPGVDGYSTIINPNSHDRLHLRAKPTKNSASLGRYFNGTQVAVIGFEVIGDIHWMHVRVDGKEGYMMANDNNVYYINGLYSQTPEWGNG